MPVSTSISRTVILYEATEYGGDFGRSFAAGLKANGCQVAWAKRDEPFPTDADLVLAYGPFTRASSMLPAARRLAALPRQQRPLFAWWLTEGIPDPRLPLPLVHLGSRIRLKLDRHLPLTHSNTRIARQLASGHRLRIFGELRWLQAHGVLDVLAVTSGARARYWQARGLKTIVVPLGYEERSYGKAENLPRDIDVGFLGDLRSSRRARLLKQVSDDLDSRGIRVDVQNELYGEARTRFLNRTRILLNILRAPQDFVGQRFLLAGANKILVVSEPLQDSAPFQNGEHIVAAPLGELADKVAFYLAHEDERIRLTENAYHLATRELTTKKMVARILQEAQSRRAIQQGIG